MQGTLNTHRDSDREHLDSSVHLICAALGCGMKLEFPKKTHADMGRMHTFHTDSGSGWGSTFFSSSKLWWNDIKQNNVLQGPVVLHVFFSLNASNSKCFFSSKEWTQLLGMALAFSLHLALCTIHFLVFPRAMYKNIQRMLLFLFACFSNRGETEYESNFLKFTKPRLKYWFPCYLPWEVVTVGHSIESAREL